MENIGDIIGLLVIVGVVALKAIGNVIASQQERENKTGSTAEKSRAGRGNGGFSWENLGWEPETATTAASAPKRANQPAAKPKERVSSAAAYSEPAAQEAASAYQKLESGEGYSWDAPKEPEYPSQPDAHQQPYQTWGGSEAPKTSEGGNTGDVRATTIADESFQYAFPEAMRKVRRLKRGTRAPIVFKVNGRKDMMRAILLREVLMHPRAYDL